MTETPMATVDRPSRPSQIVAIVAAVISIAALFLAPITPVIATAGLTASIVSTRRNGGRVAFCAAVVCGLVLAAGVLIDVFLLGHHTVGTFQRAQ